MSPEAGRDDGNGTDPSAADSTAPDNWDDSSPPRLDRDALHLELAGYAGPLDLLLDLVRAGKVDLTRLSILYLARQFEVAVEQAIGRGDVPLSRLGDWLVAAANLALLRSRLLLPEDSREGQEARREAEDLRRQLADRAAVAALTDWLSRRPLLGRDVLARGAPEAAHREDSGEGRGTPPRADLTTLLRVCLELMSRPERAPAYQPVPLGLWRPPAALARMRRLLGEMGNATAGGTPLTAFIPPPATTPTSVHRRAAFASTLLAGLELAREGEVALQQEEVCGEIVVGCSVSMPTLGPIVA